MSSKFPNRAVYLTALVWAAGLFLVPFGIHLIFYQVNVAADYALDPSFGGYFYGLLFGPLVGGALGGYFTKVVLERYAAFPRMRIFPVVAAWAIAALLGELLPIMLGQLFVPLQDPVPVQEGMDPGEPVAFTPPFMGIFLRASVFWIILATLAGMVIAWEIRWSGLKINKRQLFWIAAGWGLGFALSSGLATVIVDWYAWNNFSMRDPGWLINMMAPWLSYAFSGLMGGAIGAWVTVSTVRGAVQTPQTASLPVG